MKYYYLFFRLALLVLAVVIAAIPSLKSALHHADFGQGEVFRELLFLIVPVSALSVSSTFDYLYCTFPNLNTRNFLNALGVLIVQLAGMTFGIVGFTIIEAGEIPSWVEPACIPIIVLTLCVSFVNEFMVSLNHHATINHLPRWCPTHLGIPGSAITKEICLKRLA